MISQILTSVHCPVGKEPLGMRKGRSVFKAFCEDCGFWYSWAEGKLVPTASKPKKLPEKCNCQGCRGKR
jgi:hypothetical protein